MINMERDRKDIKKENAENREKWGKLKFDTQLLRAERIPIQKLLLA